MPQFYEIDFRIDPLRDVIVGINAGIAAIRKRVDNGGWFNGLHGLEYSEPLFGLSLVAAQTYALGTVFDLNRMRASRGKSKIDKLYFYECDRVALKGEVASLKLVNAAANYFKHHDEWSQWPTANTHGFHDAEILGRVGITKETEFPCVETIKVLCGANWELITLHKIVKEWRAHVISKLL